MKVWVNLSKYYENIMHVNYSNVVNPYESSSSMGSTEVKLFILNSHMEPLEFPGLSVQFPSHYSVLVGLKTTTYIISTRTQSFLVIFDMETPVGSSA